jgi:hypothetical protein
MERGPVALFGAIVAVGLGPALWVGAQIGQVPVAPPLPSTSVVGGDTARAPGGGAAAVDPVGPGPREERADTSRPVTGRPSARPAGVVTMTKTKTTTKTTTTTRVPSPAATSPAATSPAATSPAATSPATTSPATIPVRPSSPRTTAPSSPDETGTPTHPELSGSSDIVTTEPSPSRSSVEQSSPSDGPSSAGGVLVDVRRVSP